MSRHHHRIPLASSQYTGLPTPLRMLLLVALALTLLVGLAIRAAVTVAVIIFGSR